MDRLPPMTPDADAAWRVPPKLADLLERPLLCYLATRRPDGTLQCNPMWFRFNGETVELSHTSDRQKFRNLAEEPSLSLCVSDPDNTYRYIEVRGVLDGVRADENATFHRDLRRHYGMDPTNVPDAAVRVVLTIRPTWMGGRHMEDQTTSKA